MDKYLNMGIKELISIYPNVGTLLEKYGVGCVTCSVGTCLLKDVLSIHNFERSEQEKIMKKIFEIIEDPSSVSVEEDDVLPDIVHKEISYSEPIQILVNEHKNIKLLLSLIPLIINSIRSQHVIDIPLVERVVYFIKNYADKFHHAKEEDILFKYADETQEIIKVMHEDHNIGRGYVLMIVEGCATDSPEKVMEGLTNYAELLFNHIRREDEILYPWFDKLLNPEQKEEMMALFLETEEKLGNNITIEFENFLKRYSYLYR